MTDFTATTRAKLARKGISVYGLTVIPGAGALPFATGVRGYKVNDNGCGRIWTYAEVMEASR
jgi:hypothetical protein